MRNLEETFRYDDLNRLTDVQLGAVFTGASAYDSYGRMTAKTADGQAVFSGAVYNAAGKPHAMAKAAASSSAFPEANQAVDYTGFDKVCSIKQGRDSLRYTYGYDHRRIAMTEYTGDTVRSKRYVGTCEQVTVIGGNTASSHWLTHLAGSTGVYAVVEKRGGEETLHYILKDNLGSWTTVTDSEGNVEQRLSYDAWGNLRNPYTWSGSFTGTPKFDRGFTGHEHHSHFGLINMKFTLSERSAKLCLSTAERCELGGANGRMYDPLMCSFLSVDTYVQDPGNAQNFNRYAYCLNNPLKYTDPDGEWVHLVFAGLIGGTVNWIANGAELSWKGLAYFGIGAAAGVLGAGVGAGVNSIIGGGSFGAGFIGSTAAKTAVSSFASGAVIGGSSGLAQGFVTGAGNAWMQGCSFGEGMLQGVQAGGKGLLSGGIVGGVAGGVDAMRHGRRFLSGDYVKKYSRDYPKGVDYSQTGNDCAISVGKTIYDYDHDTGISCNQISVDCNFGVQGPVLDADFWTRYGDQYDYEVIQFSRLANSDLPRPSLSSLVDDFSNGSHVVLSLSEEGSTMTHTVLVREMETRLHITWGHNAGWEYVNKIWFQDPRIGYLNDTPITSVNRILNAFVIR